MYDTGMSILHPPPGFPPHLAMIWPLIWAQILMLRAIMRARYGKGVEYHWSITPWGQVFLVSVDWIPGQPKKPDWLKRAGLGNERLVAALSGNLLTPAYARSKPFLLGEKGLRMRGGGIAACAVPAETSRPLTSPPLPRERGLPLPET